MSKPSTAVKSEAFRNESAQLSKALSKLHREPCLVVTEAHLNTFCFSKPERERERETVSPTERERGMNEMKTACLSALAFDDFRGPSYFLLRKLQTLANDCQANEEAFLSPRCSVRTGKMSQDTGHTHTHDMTHTHTPLLEGRGIVQGENTSTAYRRPQVQSTTSPVKGSSSGKRHNKSVA